VAARFILALLTGAFGYHAPAADPPKPLAELALDPTWPRPGRGVEWLDFSPDGKTLAARHPTKTDTRTCGWRTSRLRPS
jgi:hypothetical protein